MAGKNTTSKKLLAFQDSLTYRIVFSG